MPAGRLVPRLAPTVPGGVRGARGRGGTVPACGKRRPTDAEKRPKWPRAGGMFQTGIDENKILLDNDII